MTRRLLCLQRCLALGLLTAWCSLLSTLAAQQPNEGSAAASLATIAEERLPGGHVLRTDPEQQRLLARAEEYAREGRPDLAAALFQKLLDEAGQTLIVEKVQEPVGPTSTPLVIYRSLAQTIERKLQSQSPAVLEAYRTSADAEARALLAMAGDDQEKILSEVVRRFFFSADGDDAALKLASLALDRHDFLRAYGLLKRIVELHPNVSVPAAPLQARLAVAAAGVHDFQTADQSLAALRAAASAEYSPQTIDLIAAEVNKAKQKRSDAPISPADEWPMAYGNPERTGRMPPLPASATSGDLAELISIDWPPPVPGLGNPTAAGGVGDATVAGASPPSGRQDALEAARGSLIQQWRTGGWRPAGQMRFDASRIYFKTADSLVAHGRQPPSNEPQWVSAWQNRYELDAMTQRLALVASQFPSSFARSTASRPTSLADILLFGDRVHQSLSMDGSTVYSIEGRRTTSASPPRPQPAPWANTPRRARRNWLTAYQRAGGKALWTRSAAADESQPPGDIGFLAAPTPCGDELVVPVTDGGTIWLYGLEPATGRTLWTLYLCDEPPGGAPPWAEVVLAVKERDVYLSCGCGVALAVDTVSRSIRWAVAYRRDGKVNSALRAALGGDTGTILDFGGWDDDVAIPHAGLVVIMPSDSDRLLALDRRTGERVWESPRTSPLGSVANYCLGVHGRGLFVAGKNVVRRYDLLTGRLLAECETADSYGRGCITEDAAYLPAGDSILKLNLDLSGEPARSRVANSTDEPVGNLFSDGERFWVLGAARVYALLPLDQRLSELAERIAAGDANAQLDRMRLYLKQGRLDLALADLRAAHAQMQAQLPAEQAAARLLAVIDEQRLAQEHPAVVLSLLTDLFAKAVSPPRLSAESQRRLSDTLASAIAALRQKSVPGAVGLLLAAAPLLREDYLVTAATFAIDATAKPDDVRLLLDALERGSSIAQLISIRAAVRLAPAAAQQPLSRLLAAKDDRVRLAAARALTNLGQPRNILQTLVSLLESPNVAVRSRSHQTLQALTRQRIAFAAEGSAGDRAAAVRAWRQWFQSQGASAPLAVPLVEKTVPLGRMLIVAPGALLELDGERKESWRTRLAGAGWGCQGLPNGHRLVALNSHSSVVEFDASGREVWKKDRLPAPPTSVERLENGNTLVACGDAQQLVEIGTDGAVTRINVPGKPLWAHRLESGNTLVALEHPIQRVAEVDASGRIVWEARTGGAAPWHCVRLENGNTLVTLTQARKVVEYDPTGKTIVWSTEVSLLHPIAAQRLASGTTMIADQTGLREIDASGKETIWQLRLPGVTGLSCF